MPCGKYKLQQPSRGRRRAFPGLARSTRLVDHRRQQRLVCLERARLQTHVLLQGLAAALQRHRAATGKGAQGSREFRASRRRHWRRRRRQCFQERGAPPRCQPLPTSAQQLPGRPGGVHPQAQLQTKCSCRWTAPPPSPRALEVLQDVLAPRLDGGAHGRLVHSHVGLQVAWRRRWEGGRGWRRLR